MYLISFVGVFTLLFSDSKEWLVGRLSLAKCLQIGYNHNKHDENFGNMCVGKGVHLATR
jgi:hypothetical protein